MEEYQKEYNSAAFHLWVYCDYCDTIICPFGNDKELYEARVRAHLFAVSHLNR